MSHWRSLLLEVRNPLEDTVDYQREIRLRINYQAGYPAYTRGAPEDCYPAEPDEFEILEANYSDDGSFVPDEVLQAIPVEAIYESMEGQHE